MLIDENDGVEYLSCIRAACFAGENVSRLVSVLRLTVELVGKWCWTTIEIDELSVDVVLDTSTLAGVGRIKEQRCATELNST